MITALASYGLARLFGGGIILTQIIYFVFSAVYGRNVGHCAVVLKVCSYVPKSFERAACKICRALVCW